MDHGTEGLVTPRCAQVTREHTLQTESQNEVETATAQARARVKSAPAAFLGSGFLEPSGQNSLYRRTARIDFICNVMFAAVLVLGVALTLLWRAADAPAASVRISAPPVVAVSAPPLPAEPQRPPVHVANPFDASEVFEFPAATTSSAAHDAMAKLLLQRARIRVAQGVVADPPSPPHRLHRLAQAQPEEPAAKFYADAD
jgi:hypothetical protein